MTTLAGHDEHYVRLVWLIASGLGAALLVVLAVVYRRARARRELEEAEQILAEAFEEDTLRRP